MPPTLLRLPALPGSRPRPASPPGDACAKKVEDGDVASMWLWRIVLALRTISSLRLRERPMKKKRRAPRMRTQTAPTDMPAIAAGLRPFLLLLLLLLPLPPGGVGRGEGEGVVDEVGRMEASAGNGSPGCSMYELSRASWRWRARDVIALGFMTPTMPYVIHEPGAEQ